MEQVVSNKFVQINVEWRFLEQNGVRRFELGLGFELAMVLFWTT
jgi:hypothetical protein